MFEPLYSGPEYVWDQFNRLYRICDGKLVKQSEPFYEQCLNTMQSYPYAQGEFVKAPFRTGEIPMNGAPHVRFEQQPMIDRRSMPDWGQMVVTPSAPVPVPVPSSEIIFGPTPTPAHVPSSNRKNHAANDISIETAASRPNQQALVGRIVVPQFEEGQQGGDGGPSEPVFSVATVKSLSKRLSKISAKDVKKGTPLLLVRRQFPNAAEQEEGTKDEGGASEDDLRVFRLQEVVDSSEMSSLPTSSAETTSNTTSKTTTSGSSETSEDVDDDDDEEEESNRTEQKNKKSRQKSSKRNSSRIRKAFSRSKTKRSSRYDRTTDEYDSDSYTDYSESSSSTIARKKTTSRKFRKEKQRSKKLSESSTSSSSWVTVSSSPVHIQNTKQQKKEEKKKRIGSEHLKERSDPAALNSNRINTNTNNDSAAVGLNEQETSAVEYVSYEYTGQEPVQQCNDPGQLVEQPTKEGTTDWNPSSNTVLECEGQGDGIATSQENYGHAGYEYENGELQDTFNDAEGEEFYDETNDQEEFYDEGEEQELYEGEEEFNEENEGEEFEENEEGEYAYDENDVQEYATGTDGQEFCDQTYSEGQNTYSETVTIDQAGYYHDYTNESKDVCDVYQSNQGPDFSVTVVHEKTGNRKVRGNTQDGDKTTNENDSEKAVRNDDPTDDQHPIQVTFNPVVNEKQPADFVEIKAKAIAFPGGRYEIVDVDVLPLGSREPRPVGNKCKKCSRRRKKSRAKSLKRRSTYNCEIALASNDKRDITTHPQLAAGGTRTLVNSCPMKDWTTKVLDQSQNNSAGCEDNSVASTVSSIESKGGATSSGHNSPDCESGLQPIPSISCSTSIGTFHHHRSKHSSCPMSVVSSGDDLADFPLKIPIVGSTCERSQQTDPDLTTPHLVKYAQFIYNLYQKDQLTDIILKVDIDCFHVHRSVLACHSLYFAELFLQRYSTATSPYSSTPSTPDVLEISDISPKILRKLLEYMYTGHIVLHQSFLAEVLSVASRWRMTQLQANCITKLNDLQPLELLDFLATVYDQSSEDSAIFDNQWHRIAYHFKRISHSKQFLQLTVDCLWRLLSDDDLILESEFDVAEAAVRWVNEDRVHRVPLAGRVLSCVRFKNLTPEELVLFGRFESYILDDPIIKELILEANWYHTMCNTRRPSDATSSSFPKRNPPPVVTNSEVEEMLVRHRQW